jgi:hypothetical protein
MPAHDPRVRHASSRIAAAARWNPGADTADLAADLTRARDDERIDEIVAAAPRLTPEQAAKLRALLPAPKAGEGDAA